MKYYLTSSVGHPRNINITPRSYIALQCSNDVIYRSLAFTEQFLVALEAYRSIEKCGFELSLNAITHNNFDYSNHLQCRVYMNTAIASYLSCARSFLDGFASIMPKLISIAEFEKYDCFRKFIYTESWEYQFVEALRNYVQHHAFPIHSLNYHKFFDDEDDLVNSDVTTSLNFTFFKKLLKRPKEFFKKLDWEEFPDDVDIVLAIRSHMGGLWKIHNYFIENHSVIPSRAESHIKKAHVKFSIHEGNSILGIHACKESDGRVIDKVSLFLGWHDAKVAHIANIRNMNELRKYYVSTKSKGHSAKKSSR